MLFEGFGAEGPVENLPWGNGGMPETATDAAPSLDHDEIAGRNRMQTGLGVSIDCPV